MQWGEEKLKLCRGEMCRTIVKQLSISEGQISFFQYFAELFRNRKHCVEIISRQSNRIVMNAGIVQ